MSKVYFFFVILFYIFISCNITKSQQVDYSFYISENKENEMFVKFKKMEIKHNKILFDIELKSCDRFLLTETLPQYKIDKATLYINYYICDFPEDIEVYAPFKKIENILSVEKQVVFSDVIKVKQKSTISFEENTEKVNLRDIDKIVFNIGYIPRYESLFFDIKI